MYIEVLRNRWDDLTGQIVEVYAKLAFVDSPERTLYLISQPAHPGCSNLLARPLQQDYQILYQKEGWVPQGTHPGIIDHYFWLYKDREAKEVDLSSNQSAASWLLKK